MTLIKAKVASARDWLTADKIGTAATMAGCFLLGALYNQSQFFDPWTKNWVAWLNEWQTMITGVVAFAAAYIGTRPAREQLSEMRRQSAAAAIPTYENIASSLAAEVDKSRTTRAAVVRIGNHLLNDYKDGFVYSSLFGSKFIKMMEGLYNQFAELRTASSNNAVFDTLASTRDAAFKAISESLDSLEFTIDDYVIVGIDSNGDPEFEKRELTDNEYFKNIQTAKAALTKARFTLLAHVKAVREAHRLTQLEIAKAQRHITGLK